jgi:hypothetical protein
VPRAPVRNGTIKEGFRHQGRSSFPRAPIAAFADALLQYLLEQRQPIRELIG